MKQFSDTQEFKGLTTETLSGRITEEFFSAKEIINPRQRKRLEITTQIKETSNT